jgi:curved DNA-binding protein
MEYYSILGLEKTATPEEIKKAYRKLASQHHPDKGGDTAKFQKIQEAYATLSDPEKRQAYDNPQAQFSPHNFGFSHDPGINLNDLFNNIFGRRAHQDFRQLFRSTVSLTLQEAYEGATKTIRMMTNNGPHEFTMQVPRGIDENQQLKFENIIPNAVLVMNFRIMADLKYDRKGDNLYSTQRVSVLDLIAGGSFIFDTINGKKVEIHIKPSTQPNIQLKLPGFGMPIYGTDNFGDQIILLNPYIPDNVSPNIVEAILKDRVKYS